MTHYLFHKWVIQTHFFTRAPWVIVCLLDRKISLPHDRHTLSHNQLVSFIVTHPSDLLCQPLPRCAKQILVSAANFSRKQQRFVGPLIKGCIKSCMLWQWLNCSSSMTKQPYLTFTLFLLPPLCNTFVLYPTAQWGTTTDAGHKLTSWVSPTFIPIFRLGFLLSPTTVIILFIAVQWLILKDRINCSLFNSHTFLSACKYFFLVMGQRFDAEQNQMWQIRSYSGVQVRSWSSLSAEPTHSNQRNLIFVPLRISWLHPRPETKDKSAAASMRPVFPLALVRIRVLAVGMRHHFPYKIPLAWIFQQRT